MEMGLALAIIAIAITAILGLLPIATNAARTGRDLAQCAYLSQTIASDLRASLFQSARIFECQSSFNLADPGYIYLSADSSSRIKSVLSPEEFKQGTQHLFNGYLAGITIIPSTQGLLSTLAISIEYPSGLPIAKRNRQTFLTAIPNHR